MNIGLNIKKRRFELKMSQQNLANAMGYKTRSTIAKIESGENDISPKKLIRFAQILDTTVEELIFGNTKDTAFLQTKVQKIDNTNRNKNIVIILAGGKSNKIDQNIPIQFANVNNKPILMYSLEVYEKHPLIDDIYIVCLKGWESIVKAFVSQYKIKKFKGIITGDHTGVLSIKKAFEQIKDDYEKDDNIIIQESTRPLIDENTVTILLNNAIQKNSCTICHSMNDYVQFNISTNKTQYIDRHTTVAMQSPEIHKLSLMNHVFKKSYNIQHVLNETCFTMLLYNLGYEINFIESNINNIKIARKEDIATFKALIYE